MNSIHKQNLSLEYTLFESVLGNRSSAFLEVDGAVKKNYRKPEPIKILNNSSQELGVRAFLEEFGARAGKINL